MADTDVERDSRLLPWIITLDKYKIEIFFLLRDIMDVQKEEKKINSPLIFDITLVQSL